MSSWPSTPACGPALSVELGQRGHIRSARLCKEIFHSSGVQLMLVLQHLLEYVRVDGGNERFRHGGFCYLAIASDNNDGGSDYVCNC